MSMASAPQTTPRRRGCRGCLIFPGILAAAGLLFVIAAGLALPRLFVPGGAAGPRVQIRVPAPGAQVGAQRDEIVMIETYDSGDITRYELWVDGTLARYQIAESPTAPLRTSTQIGWRPPAAGVHVLIARAYDSLGRMGMSGPVTVEAVAPGPDQLVGVRVVVQPGDTVESLAAAYGISPEAIRQANPGLREPLMPGDEIILPVPRGQLPEDFFGVDEAGAPPAPEPAHDAPPAPQGMGEANAEPAPDGNAAPGQAPWGLGVGPRTPAPPDPPAELQLALTGGCGVQLRWTDSSASETGFRVYRLGAGNGDFRTIADLAAGDGAAWLVYDDTVLVGGTYLYYVAAVNTGGESGSPIAQIDVPREGCALSVPPMRGQAMALLQFEAVRLDTNSQFDGAYCYLSLARLAPYARIPDRTDTFFAPLRNHGWDIAGWAAGEDRFFFGQRPDEPVPVALECWGMRGREVTSLGTHAASHPSEEWDGRDLFGDTGQFRVTYRIQPRVNLPALRQGEPDPAIPAPQALHLPTGVDECVRHVNLPNGRALYGSEGPIGLWACAEIWDTMLVWSWSPNRETPRAQIDGFRVFVNREYASDPREDDPRAWESLGESGSVNEVFPIPMPSCGKTYGYQVEAFRDDEPERRSARSATWRLAGPPCPNQALVEFTLESIDVSELDDGCLLFCDDETLQAYGWGWFSIFAADGTWTNGADVWFWQDPCETGFGVACIAAFREVRNEPIDLAVEDLRMCPPCDNYGPGQNRVALTMSGDSTLHFSFWLFDVDNMEDDIWCGVTEDHGIGDTMMQDLFDEDLERKPFEIGPFDVDQWAAIDQTFSWNNSGDALSDQDARCTVRISARGLGRVP